MKAQSAPVSVRAILLDVEGTTTPIAFVTRVLFPYARTHLRAYLEEQAGSVEHELLLARLGEEHAADLRDRADVGRWSDEPGAPRVAAVAAYVEWLMDRDRKTTALKELQGRIWERGFERGDLVGEVFPDVPSALRRWHERGLAVGIFSSGSVRAQRLLFRHTSSGDLTPFVQWYFDTQTGSKVEPESYRRIAGAMGCPPGALVFLSDVARELDAARTAGLQARLSIRPGNTPPPTGHDYRTIASFDEIA